MREIELLHEMIGKDARFRDGQQEAILKALKGKRQLIVQKTGWGKSIVYFISAKILMEKGKGVTLVISPLLSLMRNQIETAKKGGVRAETINSTNRDDLDRIINALDYGKVDVLLISPERLANQTFFDSILPKLEIAMLVIDEVHCISDWGHDFRPDYKRIVRIIETLPEHTPIICTTATANNRVIDDVSMQITNLEIVRGPLMRHSLRLQMIKLDKREEKLAWLVENIPNIEGSGIIYVSTVSTSKKVAKYLQTKGIDAYAYSSEEDNREKLEESFMNNDTKVLVATTALGMGYDKADISFVIHFHSPSNIVSYYQQIGRAGRGIDKAYVIMLKGLEDDNIQKYFIENALPKRSAMEAVLNIIEEENGISVNQIMTRENLQKKIITHCLKLLEIEGAIFKDKSKYYRTTNKWAHNTKLVEQLQKVRLKELDELNEMINTKDCYMKFIADKLDDKNTNKCGKCSNCYKKYFKDSVDVENVVDALNFLNKQYQVIEPRKQWPSGIFTTITFPQDSRNEKGIVLSEYNDAGYGTYVKEDKYDNGKFRNELIIKSKELIEEYIDESNYIIAFVPSLNRPDLVKNFAISLAKELKCDCIDIISKKKTPQQKEMKNSYAQCKNAFNGFYLNSGTNIYGKTIILVDDICDSRWTLTCIGYLLKEKGASKVYPYALASASRGD